MSGPRFRGSVGRLRSVARDAPHAGRAEVMTEDVRRVIADLDAATARAEAAEAEVARLRANVEQYEADARDAAGELLVAIPTPGTDAAKVMVASRIMRGQRDAARAEVARLRAAMGRTVPPTDAEWAAIVEHDCTLIVTAEPSMTTTVATRGELDALCDAADEAGEAYVWIVVGADGWPRPWPTGGDAGR